MRRVKIEIKTENAAFHPEPGVEVARILRKAADTIESGGSPNIMDINGNKVGSIEVIEDADQDN